MKFSMIGQKNVTF